MFEPPYENWLDIEDICKNCRKKTQSDNKFRGLIIRNEGGVGRV